MASRLVAAAVVAAIALGGCGTGRPGGSMVGCALHSIQGRLVDIGGELAIDRPSPIPIRWWSGWIVGSHDGRTVIPDETRAVRARPGDEVRLQGGTSDGVWLACPVLVLTRTPGPS